MFFYLHRAFTYEGAQVRHNGVKIKHQIKLLFLFD